MLRFLLIVTAATTTILFISLYYNYIVRFHRIHLFGNKTKNKINYADLLHFTTLEEFILRQKDKPVLELLKLRKNPLVICLGDSITNGIISTNYVEMLQEKYLGRLLFINSGLNGNLAYNLNQRLETDCLELDPDFVTILIGTNDANSQKNRKIMKRYIKYQKLPKTPDFNFFRENLTHIIERLKNSTNTEIIILSLPVIGEQLDSEINGVAAKYSEEIKRLAGQYNLHYLPLNETQTSFLAGIKDRHPAIYLKKRYAINIMHMLRRSFDKIALSNGRFLTYDGLHETTKGAEMIASLISEKLDQLIK